MRWVEYGQICHIYSSNYTVCVSYCVCDSHEYLNVQHYSQRVINICYRAIINTLYFYQALYQVLSNVYTENYYALYLCIGIYIYLDYRIWSCVA